MWDHVLHRTPQVDCQYPPPIRGVGGTWALAHFIKIRRFRRCTRHLMPGILNRMACGVALALAIAGRVSAADPPPGGKKTAIFEECLMCIKHRKYRQKWPLGGASLGQGAGAQKTRTQAGNLYFSDFLIIFDVAFLCKNLGTCKKHRKYRQKMRLRTRLELQKWPCC